MIYFTSDLHLGHKNIIRLCNRPFQNVNEMNETLIHNWNNIIQKDDTVYILGDLCFKKEYDLIKKLSGHKILIRGNHDSLNYDVSLFDEICDFKVLKYNKMQFTLMHYPLVEWPHYFHGGFHLHGHQHNKSDYNLKMLEIGIKRYDVGVDANEYKPISIDEIIEFFSDIKENSVNYLK